MSSRANFIVDIQANMFLISLLFIFSIFAVVLTLIGGFSIDKARNNKFKKTNAEVTKIVSQSKKTIKGKRDTYKYYTSVAFKYYVNGEEYSGKTTLIDNYNYKTIGYVFQIEYNPKNPTVYRTPSMSIVGSIFMLIVGIMFFILAISVILCMRSKSCREYAAITSLISGGSGGFSMPNFNLK